MIPLAASRGHRPASASCRETPSNRGISRSFPSGCRTCWARCWTRWSTCTNWTSSTGDCEWPGCFRRKGAESPRAPVPLGRIGGERCGRGQRRQDKRGHLSRAPPGLTENAVPSTSPAVIHPAS